ncbi:MAG: hypothetical protein JNK33_02545 [Candidatus Doudnabacteria bacterium]|nr:hypothetical protein [Candidatus Doudnabacteria bacterium]
MSDALDSQKFAAEWLDVAQQIVARIYAEEAVQRLHESYATHGSFTLEQRSDFIAIANRVKSTVLHELYGPEGSSSFQEFQLRWRNWYDHKGTLPQENRRLTNAEHIIYSSTPDVEEFFSNFDRENKGGTTE